MLLDKLSESTKIGEDHALSSFIAKQSSFGSPRWSLKHKFTFISIFIVIASHVSINSQRWRLNCANVYASLLSIGYSHHQTDLHPSGSAGQSIVFHGSWISFVTSSPGVICGNIRITSILVINFLVSMDCNIASQRLFDRSVKVRKGYNQDSRAFAQTLQLLYFKFWWFIHLNFATHTHDLVIICIFRSNQSKILSPLVPYTDLFFIESQIAFLSLPSE